jgi:hypothetical protein
VPIKRIDYRLFGAAVVIGLTVGAVLSFTVVYPQTLPPGPQITRLTGTCCPR